MSFNSNWLSQLKCGDAAAYDRLIEQFRSPLKVAQPEGSLSDGSVTIRHSDGTSLRVNDLLNGVDRNVLSGGLYQVWVRWLPPSQTIEECKLSLAKQLEFLRTATALAGWNKLPHRTE